MAPGVVHGGDLAWFHGHGVADTGSKDPVTEDTVFRIGSVTKTITAVAVVAGTVEGQALAAASMRSVDPQRVEVWTVPGAAHVQGLGAAPDEWERRVVGFLDNQLGP